MGFFKINKRYLMPKAHYFFYFGVLWASKTTVPMGDLKLNTYWLFLVVPKHLYNGVGAFWPYVTVFAKQLGVSEVSVGLLFAIAPVAGIISMPLFGMVADKFMMKRKLFLIFNVINILSLLGFACLPQVNTSRQVSLKCDTGVTYIVQKIDTADFNDSRQHCNAINILSYHRTTRSVGKFPHGNLDWCHLSCMISTEELSNLCQPLLTQNVPNFCNDSNFSGTEPLTLEIGLNTVGALIINSNNFKPNTLYIPVKGIKEGNRYDDVYSCSTPSTFSSCNIDCYENPTLNMKMERFDSVTYSRTSYYWYVFLVLVSWISMAVVTSVADALCFQTLGDNSNLYGQQRQWGAIGWGLFSLISGILIDAKSEGSLAKNYNSTFYLVALLMGVNLIVCYMWKVPEEKKPYQLRASILRLLMKPAITVFIMACVVVGICTGLLWHFLFWYVEDLASCEQTKYIKHIEGLISIVQCFGGELPFFYISGWFIKKLGHIHCMTLVLGSFALRFLIYSFLSNPWTILPVELLQGLTYGVFYSTMASYAYVVSSEGSVATLQGIVGAAFEGVGVGIGSLMGGILYEHVSPRMSFRIFGLSTLVACLAHFLSMSEITKRFSVVPVQPGNEGPVEKELKDLSTQDN